MRWSVIYRSDEGWTDDVPLVSTAIDFRDPIEGGGSVDCPSQADCINLPILYPPMAPDRVRDEQILNGKGEFHELLLDANHSFVMEPRHQEALGEFLNKLADPDTLPVVFHCTYGKDRTGVAASLVLHVLGVPRETILEDYMLSNEALAGETGRMSWLIKLGSLGRISRDQAKDLLGVRQEYLEAAWNAIDEEYGMDKYIENVLGVPLGNQKKIRKNLLEPSSVSLPKARTR